MKNFNISSPNIIQPIILGKPFFKRKPLKLQANVTRWRGIADMVNLSSKGRLRLEWMIFYETIGQHNAYATSKHFSISAKPKQLTRRRWCLLNGVHILALCDTYGNVTV